MQIQRTTKYHLPLSNCQELESQIIQRCAEIATELILVNSLLALSAAEYAHILKPSNSIPEYISYGNFAQMSIKTCT